MSLSGTAVFILWLVVNRVWHSGLKEKWKRNLLLLSIPFYLIPLPYWKHRIYDVFTALYLLPVKGKENIVGIIDKKFAVITDGGRVVAVSSDQKIVLIIASITAIVSIVILLYKSAGYFYFRLLIHKCPRIVLSMEESDLFDLLKQEAKIKSEVIFLRTDAVSAPFTIGLRRPIILIPGDLQIEDDNSRRLLLHELAHIRHKDMLVCILGLIVVAVHWYNPFCYIYFYVLQNANEQYSDETVTEGISIKEKLSYCELLVDMSVTADVRIYFLQMNFAGSAKKQIKRRIDSIIKKKKASLLLAMVLAVLFLFSGTCVVFAYEAPLGMEGGGQYDTEVEEKFSLEVERIKRISYDDSFIDANGRVYPVEQSNTKAACKHTFVSGVRETHSRIGKGCKIDYYNAKRCTKCGYTVIGDMYSTTTWKVCPH